MKNRKCWACNKEKTELNMFQLICNECINEMNITPKTLEDIKVKRD